MKSGTAKKLKGYGKLLRNAKKRMLDDWLRSPCNEEEYQSASVMDFKK